MFLARCASGGLGKVELSIYNALQFAEGRNRVRVGALGGFDKALESQEVQECDSMWGELDLIHFS